MEPVKKLDRSVKGRAVLVTGAASGMGRATAHLFAQEGALVAVTDINEAGVARVVEEITAAGGTAHGWRLDVSEHAEIKRVVARGRSALRPARYPRQQRRLRRLLSARRRRLRPHLGSHDRGTADCATADGPRRAAVHLRKSDAARIVNIASTEGLGATPGDSPYAVAKTGVIGLTRALAVDLGPEGITVNCICPGPIRTALTDAIPEEHKTIFAKRRTALKRYGYPEEVAHITFSLCLPAASYITGAIIPVDGGLMIRNA